MNCLFTFSFVFAESQVLAVEQAGFLQIAENKIPELLGKWYTYHGFLSSVIQVMVFVARFVVGNWN